MRTGSAVCAGCISPALLYLSPFHLAPSTKSGERALSVVYLPTYIVVCLAFKLLTLSRLVRQAKTVARALSGRIALPDAETMETEISGFYEELKEAGMKMEHTHLQVRLVYPIPLEADHAAVTRAQGQG
jgi:hypothetical protein